MKFDTFNSAHRGVIAMLMAFFLGAGALSASAQVDPKYYAVEVSATVLTAPPQVRLTWSPDAKATGYTVYRKAPTATSWTQLAALGATANNYVDGNVTVGSTFEYRLRKTTSAGYTGHGYVLAGINAPLVESRGKLVLIVDNTHASTLATELARLQQDLAGDGWVVLRHDVSPTATAQSVKALIKADYDADPANVKTVFLFGHVPVPRSGNTNPDGHPDHKGAWSADAYYADMNGTWGDTTVNTTAAERSVNHNTPGDGKFDPSTLPSDLELAVGRVDLSNMTCFWNKTPSRSELDLLRQYLNKDHNFRHGIWSLPRRGLVCDNFGDIYGEAFAASGWRSFAPMFGLNTTYAAPAWTFFSTLNTEGYLWSYGTGGGTYTTCNGIGGSDDFALNDPKTAFVMLLGSYFGDWDNESNFLRATLGSSSHTLTVSWAGRPHWFYHHMGLGETIGRSALASQNNNGTYEAQTTGSRGVHTGLLGDPTLRLHPVLPVSNLLGTPGTGLALSWTGSADTNLQGFHVYRATNAAGPFTRLTSNLVGATSFTDAAPVTNAVYMVRAVKLETSGSGTYFNASQGVFYTNGVTTIPNPPPTPTPATTNSAVFVKSDTTTGGTWPNVYGKEGHWIYSAMPSLPGYATVAPVGASLWTWNYNVANTQATVLPGTSIRVAACWYGSQSFGFDVGIKDGQTHQFSAYFLDWDTGTRKQRVEIVDATTGAILNSQTISNFSKGIYLTWKVSGAVRLRITPLAGNAVVSALFFDELPAAFPNVPGNFAATALNSSQIKLTWMDGSTDELGFRVFCRRGNSPYQEIASTPSGSTSFTNSALLSETEYSFKICAFNSAGASAFTVEKPASTAPYAPNRLAAVALSGTQVQFSWADNSSFETGFKIFRRVLGGSYSQIGSTLPNATTWLDATVLPGIRYYYTVCAGGTSIDSGFSSEVSQVTPF